MAGTAGDRRKVSAREKSSFWHYMDRLRDPERGGSDRRLEEFAKRADSSVAYLWQIANGARGAGPKAMRGIVTASGGDITYAELIELNPTIDRPSLAGVSMAERRESTA